MNRPHNENQWLVSFLIDGFDAGRRQTPSDRVRSFRQARLKRMVLDTIYERAFEEEPSHARRAHRSI